MLPQIGVVVGTDRVAAARLARERLGAEVVILDDGFQHRALHRDLDLLLVAAETDLRGARMIPLGDLREPLRQIRRADAVVLTGPPRRLPGASEAVEALLRRLDHPVPVFPCERRHDGLWSVERGEEVPATALQGLRLLAFSGIARPGGFEEDLADLGIRPAASLRFRDHQPFGPAEIERIRAEARRAAADLLVTTEKDRMRLLAAPPLPLPLYTLRIRLVPREPEDLWGFAAARLFGSASREREAG
jgi:tetraacyldisaccharide 4'-kinase